METVRICPQCHKPLPVKAPQGLCPECLFKAGLASQTTISPSAAATPGRALKPPAPAELAPHFPQLEILELLGAGGMGMVYQARQPQLDRLVALKILSPEIVTKDAAFADRFLREARALARLNHPNIVAVYDFGQAGPYYFFLMEFVDGANLRQLLNGPGITPRTALGIVPPICDALQFAHDEGVMHRDIKPENILVDRRGRVKIADFGLAKLIGPEQPGSSALTQSGVVMGTPRYMAPEQLEKPQTVDHRADIYSLGVVFYEMLTGELPLGRFDPPSHRVGVDVRLDEVVLRSLEKKPERRYQKASEVKTDVESIAGSTPPTAGPSAPPVRHQAAQEKVPAAATARAGLAAVELRPRFSRKAIVGAAWVPLAFAAFAATFAQLRPEDAQLQPGGAVSHGPVWWQWILILLLVLPGMAAPFGTTILGMIALHDIRHSKGQITGLALALADALLFPLLVLDALLAWVSYKAVFLICNVLLSTSVAAKFQPLCAIVAVIVCLAVDTVLIILAWRAARNSLVYGKED